MLRVIGIDPGKAPRRMVQRMQRGFAAVQMVQRAHQPLYPLVAGILQQPPIQLPVFRPFPPGCQFLAHEKQFLAGMAPHKAPIGAQIGKALPIIHPRLRHAAEQGGLAMHNLVMAQRQQEILIPGIEDGEIHQPVVMGPLGRSQRHVAQRVIHPAHVPLHVEAQAPLFRRAGNAGPVGRILGDHQRAGHFRAHQGIEAAEEGHGIKVFPAAIRIGRPFALGAGIIQPDHRADRIHPQPIGMVFAQPEQRIGDEESQHLRPAKIIDRCAPIGMRAAPGVGVFVKRLAGEHRQPMRILGEMRRHPVQQHADLGLMRGIDEAFEPGRFTQPGGGRVQANRLIAPAHIERMLHHRHQLDMGKPQIHDIGDEGCRQFIPIPEPSIPMPLPGGGVDLIDAHRLAARLAGGAALQPGGIAPAMDIRRMQQRGGARPQFGGKAIRVGFERQDHALAAADFEFIGRTRMQPGQKNLPQAAIHPPAHRVAPAIPAVEIPHH